ncbi:MAG: guanosine monophosphate reductase [Nitrospirae bacterium]|nr:MAG: guanosine monophosphate reductase [Nitrospirota bacterium]
MSNSDNYSDNVLISFDDVLIKPKYSNIISRDMTDIYCNLSKNTLFAVPIISANMDTITEYEMALNMARMGGCGIVHRYMSIQRTENIVMSLLKEGVRPFMAVGSVHNDRERIEFLLNVSEDIAICIDIAHGHSSHMRDTLKFIRHEKKSECLVIAGNVATPEGVADLANWGADVVKVGVGGGSVCTTREKTGIGIPQLSAIQLCARDANVHIIADGGIRKPSDAVKAIAAGATCIMIGGMLAGTDWTPGWKESYEAHAPMEYRGMASAQARMSCNRASRYSEGVARRVLPKPPGSSESVLKEIVDGLRSAMSYVGAKNLEEFRQNVEFVRCSPSVVKENAPHFSDN